MKETITESRRMVEQESASYKRTFTREKEHRAKLEKLGLTEAEALEYVLMLSREEALGKGDLDANQAIGEEGVFDIDESLESAGYERVPSTSSIRRSPSTSSVSTTSDQTRGSYGGSPASYGRYGAENPQASGLAFVADFFGALYDVSPCSSFVTRSDIKRRPVSSDCCQPNAEQQQHVGSESARSPSGMSPSKSWSSAVGSSSSSTSQSRSTQSASGLRYALLRRPRVGNQVFYINCLCFSTTRFVDLSWCGLYNLSPRFP